MKGSTTLSCTSFLPCCPKGTLTCMRCGGENHSIYITSCLTSSAVWQFRLEFHQRNLELFEVMEGEEVGFRCGTGRVQRRWVRMSSALWQRHPFTTASCCWGGTHSLSRTAVACGSVVVIRVYPTSWTCWSLQIHKWKLVWTQGPWGSKVTPLHSEADMVLCIWTQSCDLGWSQVVLGNLSSGINRQSSCWAWLSRPSLTRRL